jgi:DNA-binding HxlR family transcriptional regulator
MPPSTRDQRSGCPISTSLELYGDRWSLLIVRDLLTFGCRRFGDFLTAEESIASNILSERLQRLEQEGVIESASDPADGRRRLYYLTAKGFALAPIVAEIVIWAAAHVKTTVPPDVVAFARDDRAGFIQNWRGIWLEARRKGRLPEPQL